MRKIKIAYIITRLELGGAQKIALSVLENLDKNLYDPYLITSPGGYLDHKAQSMAGVKCFFIDDLKTQIDIKSDVICFFKIARYLKAEGIMIVHTHSSKAGIIGRWAAWRSGVKKIFHTVHGWPFYIESFFLKKWIYRILEQATAFITTKLIVVSDHDLFAGLNNVTRKKEKYIKIPYGIDVQKFCSLQRNRTKDMMIQVGYVACYKPQKAPFHFLKVVQMVTAQDQRVEFVSAGDGVLKPEVIKKAFQMGLEKKIKFLGWQSNIEDVLSKIDILLLTSRWEGLPVIVLESLAAGIPVVATAVGGVSEVVIHGFNGFVEQKEHFASLAQDILLLARDETMRSRFSAQASSSLRSEFDIAAMMPRMSNLYNF